MNTCNCYHEEDYATWDSRTCSYRRETRSECWGTKERDLCSCEGDEAKCDFYEYKRKEAQPSVVSRPTKTEYYLNIAAEVAKRSTCLRRKYGAIIVKNDEIISTGYNGSPRGEENCCDVGSCWREKHGIPHGEQYEKCVAVHAEQNAIISASRRDMLGATLYLAGWENEERIKDPQPCAICAKLIKNAGIQEIINSSDLR